MNTLFRIVLAGALCAVIVETADAQRAQTRDGFWFAAGPGWGSLGCGDCEGRESGMSGALALGGTLNDRWLLGGTANGWTKSEDGATLTVAVVTALARFYPMAASGFFVQGGLGFGKVEVGATFEGSSFSVGESGAGAILGIGYDVRVSSNISVSPYWNAYAMSTDLFDANVGQLGLALTVH